MSKGPTIPGHPLSSLGFTLLELLVVLVIISLMSALLVPNMAGSLSSMDLKTAAKKTSAALRYAQSRAVSEKTTCAVCFDFNKRALFILTVAKSPNDTGMEHSGGDTAKPKKQKTYFLPDGIRLEKGVSSTGEMDSGLFRIYFFPAGGSSGGEVILTNDRGKQYSVSVDFITGVVKLAHL